MFKTASSFLNIVEVLKYVAILWDFFFQKREPNSLCLECMPDLQLSSNEENVIAVMPCDFQGQFIKEMAST